MQSRYYDAGVGRFVNEDEPLLLGVSGGVCSYNLYAYCENDPVNNSDPWGHSPKWVHLIKGIKLITTGLMALISAILNGFIKSVFGSLTAKIITMLVTTALSFLPLGQYWGTIINVGIIVTIILRVKTMFVNVFEGLWHLGQAIEHTHK